MTASPRASSRYLPLAACMVLPAVSNGVFISCFPLWVVPWIAEFHVSRSLVMSGFGIGNIVMGLASPLVGYVLERTSPRLSVALGGAALGLGLLAGSVLPSIWQVIVIYATLMALGAAFTGLLSAQTAAVDLYPDRAGTIGGFITLGISGGGIVMPALLAGPVVWYGWRAAFAIAGAIVLATMLPASLFLRGGRGGGTAGLHEAGHASPESARLTTRAVLASPAFWLPLFGIVPVMFVVGTVLTNSVAIAADDHVNLRLAGYLVSVIALGGAIGSVSLGWLADRADYRIVFGCTAGVMALSLLMLNAHPGFAALAFIFAAVGFGGGGAIPLFSAIVVRRFGIQAFPRVMGLILPSVILSLAVAPALAGGVRDLTGSYAIDFDVCAVLLLMGGLLVCFTTRRNFALNQLRS